jgi:putative transposase
MRSPPYPSDLSDEEWKLLEPLLPSPAHTGRKRKYELREIVNAIFYLLRSGCTWRMLPRDLPPWQVVYWHFAKWRSTGVWQRINDALRTELRVRDGREAEPSAAIMDSQSVKTTEKGGQEAMMLPRR